MKGRGNVICFRHRGLKKLADFCIVASWIWLRFCNIITVCIINELLSINGATWVISPGIPATGCFHTGNNGLNGIRSLTTESHEVLKLRDIRLELSDRSMIAVETHFRFQNDTIMQTPYHGFETLRDLTLSCLTAINSGHLDKERV